MGKSKIILKKLNNFNKITINLYNSVSVQGLFSKVFLIFIIVPLACCGTQEKRKTRSNQNEYQSIAITKYRGNIEYFLNDSKSHVICLTFSKPGAMQPHPELKFFIFAISKGEILFEDSLLNAKVSWISNSQAEVEFIPEIISGDEDITKSGYVFDVNTMKKRPLNPHP
jgi:hypothetical protein